MRFLLKQWDKLPSELQTLCVTYQNLLDEVPLEELPRFLTAADARIREATIHCMRGRKNGSDE